MTIEVDPASVPPKLKRIDRLMADLAELEPHPGAVGARQLILDLLGMSDLPRGESIYKAVVDAGVASLDPEDRHPGPLADSVRFTKRWVKDIFPATDDGKVHLGRALLETLIASAEAHLEEHGPKPTID